MLQFIIGSKTKPGLDHLIEEVRRLGLPEGNFYVGYPVLASHQEPLSLDAVLVCQRHGLVIFDLLREAPADMTEEGWRTLAERQEQIFLSLQSKLLLSPELVTRRQLQVPIEIFTYAPRVFNVPSGLELKAAHPGNLILLLRDAQGIDTPERYRALNAAIERVATLKPRKKRPNVTRPTSRGATLREIEKEIANLDRYQKRGAIESPEGPQRIRGLAGSGKTIVLALKAAYLHAQHPDWRIVVTFHSRALQQQFTDLVRRFSFEHTSDEPDWTQLRVLHSWGSPRDPGLYAEIAGHYGVSPLTWSEAKQRYGWERAFEGACRELEEHIATHPRPPIYDAVLLDEAQDVPLPFFRIVYAAMRSPKRIVWASDELQNLGVFDMAPPATLFGSNAQGRPRVELHNDVGQPHQDVILKKCYRNTPWALTVAHALGFGIYRREGLVQFFAEETLWEEIGYEIREGKPLPGHHVVMRRARDSYPDFFPRLIAPSEAVQCHVFHDAEEQAQWVAEQIARNLTDDELEPSDIVVIFPDPLTVPQVSATLRRQLSSRGIVSHVAGVTSSRDQFFVDDSVTITGIYRAKGNEAAMVYILDSQYCDGGYELIRKRNTLFTAITRSKAWIRICGYGPGMDALRAEIDTIIDKDYDLDFLVPADADLGRLKHIHRDMTPGDRRQVDEATEKAVRLAEQLETGSLEIEHLPREVRERLARLLQSQGGDKG